MQCAIEAQERQSLSGQNDVRGDYRDTRFNECYSVRPGKYLQTYSELVHDGSLDALRVMESTSLSYRVDRAQVVRPRTLALSMPLRF